MRYFIFPNEMFMHLIVATWAMIATPKCSFGRTPSSVGVRCLSQFLQYLLVTVHLVAVHLKSIRSSETLLYISIGSERAHPHCGHWVWSASLSTSIFGSGLRCDDLFLVFFEDFAVLGYPLNFLTL